MMINLVDLLQTLATWMVMVSMTWQLVHNGDDEGGDASWCSTYYVYEH